jgi:hypothetical protein
MSDDPWCWLVDAPDMPSANVLLETLAADAVIARIVADSVLLGEARPCRVFVRQSEVHRARWLTRRPQLSEAELTHLALGAHAAPERDCVTSAAPGEPPIASREDYRDERG